MYKVQPNQMSNPLYTALIAQYKAQREKALATLHVYFNNSVGIGEHPQFIEEMQAQIQKLADAEDHLDALERNFDETGQLKRLKAVKGQKSA